MTIEQLQEQFPSATAETWHQHSNGGGWVENTAIVEVTAQVSGNARVSGDARVYGYARVYGNAWKVSPLQIQGTRHSLNACTATKIQIGCYSKEISWWLEHYKEIGAEEGYFPAEIEEYGLYIYLFTQRYQPELLRKSQ